MRDVLAIVGSTRFVDMTAVEAATLAIEGVLTRRRPDVVVSGGAVGVDTLAARLARARGIEVVEHLPANPRWEPDGYKARNDKIADSCTRLLRVVCRWSTTYGSGYTHDRAARQGKMCWSLQLPTNVLNGLVWVDSGTQSAGVQVEGGLIVDVGPKARALDWVGRDADELIRDLVKRKVPVRWAPTQAKEATAAAQDSTQG